MAATPQRIALTMPQAVPETSAVLWEPARDRGSPVVVCAHGAGTDASSSLVRLLGRGLAAHSIPTWAFNFAYAEAGRKRPDPPQRLEGCFRDVLQVVRARYGPSRPIVLGGRSMGGRIASHLAADGEACAGLLLAGYPLHPAGKPERLRTDHWPRLRVPILFISGDRDALCGLDLLERERERHLRHSDHRLHIVAGADHGFAVRKADGRAPDEVQAEIVGVAAEWVQRLAAEVSA